MEWFTTAVLIITGLLLLYKYFTVGQRKSGLSGPKAYPIFGSALLLKPGQIHMQLSELARQYGRIYEMRIFGTTNMLLNSVDVVNRAFCVDGFKQVFNDRPSIYIAEHIYKAQNITLRNPGKLHGDLRKVLSKGLHVYGDGIPIFEDIMKTEIQRVMEEIENAGEQGFEVVDLAKRSLCNVMSILLTGDVATEAEKMDYFEFMSLQDYLASPVNDMLIRKFPFLRHTPLYKKEFDTVMLIREKILERMFHKVKDSRSHGTVRGLIDWYLAEQHKELEEGGELLLSDEVIKANLLDILSAGILTTSSVLPSALLCLTNHPEYQTKIQEELERVVGTGREPSVSDKHQCDFIEAVIMETMRYLPPAPLQLPHICSKDTVFEGYTIQEKTQVMANVWHIHHDENVWGDPWVFRPERFLDKNGKLLANTHVNMKSFLTFGTGRRKCPGMSLGITRLYLYLSHLLKRWTFIPVPGKCGSCDPRSGSYECELLLKPKAFYCIAKSQNYK